MRADKDSHYHGAVDQVAGRLHAFNFRAAGEQRFPTFLSYSFILMVRLKCADYHAIVIHISRLGREPNFFLVAYEGLSRQQLIYFFS
jgi:hypothetical protein